MKKLLSVVLATLLVLMPTLQISIFAAPAAVSTAEAAIESQTNTETFEEDVSELSSGTNNYIYTADDLANVANNLSGVYYLMNDIDLSSYDNWTPIGTGIDNGKYFSGLFNGNGHTITGINIQSNGYSYSGLFGVSAGVIKNLNVEATITDAQTAGALIGLLYLSGTVENCSSSGSVAGTNDVGGLIGRADTGHYINTILIRNCYSMASATSTSTYEGDGCGGLVGEIYGHGHTTNVKIVSCYAAGKVTKTGTTGIGGIVGYSHTYDGGSYAILASYYCSSTTKQGDTNRGFMATSTQMRQKATFANWDFENIWDINASVNGGFPSLKLSGEYKTFTLEGSGTSRDPYIITTEAELAAIARGEITNNYTAYYQLGNDITLSSNYWTPIGGNGMPDFEGTFDGAGYTIYNVNICVPAFSYSGLFGCVTGTVRNLNVTATISDTMTSGALMGLLYLSGTVENCSSSGSVAGTNDVGGLIGRADTGHYINTILIRNCYSMASATSTSTYEGDGCGGLVGEIYGHGHTTNVKIVSCYAAGKVTKTGTTGVGGIVGYSHTYDGGSYAILASFYAEDLTMQIDEERAFGVPSAKLLQKSTFANWDFENIWDINSSINNGYPYLKLTGEYNTFELEGSGTSRDPYIVTTEAELAAIARGEITNNYTAYYQLGNDITLSSNYWTPIGGNGMPHFSGSFDGAGFMIYNVNICAPAYVCSGLFGYVSGTIKNLGVTANISNGITVGALAGELGQTATVENCYSDGNVSGSSNAGGLIGLAQSDQNSATISITNCYSMANTSSTNTSNNRGCGGLVGWAYGYSSNSTVKIENCYATGNVTKSSTTGLGGLVGLASKYYGSYTILSSYYDNYTDSSTDKGTYAATEDMKNQSNYAVWDFENVWAISDALNEGYPYLQILVPAGAISVTEVSINKLSTTLTVGESEVLTATILPTNASNQNVKWTSSNENIVTVTDGVIEAIDTGVATITVETIDGGKTATCTVSVKEKDSTEVNVTGISLNKSSLDLTIGETASLTATVTPTNATNKAVTWTSTNSSVATVNANGVVKAVDAGDAVIIVTTNDGGKTAFCSVSVSGIPTDEPDEPDDPDTPVIPDEPEEPVEYKATMTLSDVSGRQGETVKVIVSLKTDEIINTIGIRDITYDTSVLTFAGFSDYEELQSLCQLSQFDESKMAVVAALKNAQVFDGTICALNFIINEDAEECEIEIGAVANIKYSHDTIATEVVPATVTVRSQILGDINLDEYVDMNDAILLLQYSMFPDLYPIEYRGSVDFTNDGFIDMNDAILLLQYSMFPDLYPIQ